MKSRLVPSAKEDVRRLSKYYDSVRFSFGDVFSDRVTEFVQRIQLNPQLYGQVTGRSRMGNATADRGEAA